MSSNFSHLSLGLLSSIGLASSSSTMTTLSDNNETKINYDRVSSVPIKARSSEGGDVDNKASNQETSMMTSNNVVRCCNCCHGCCSVGCFWGIIACLYFFVILPTGVLLILHGHNKGVPLTLALGLIILFIFTCGIPGAFLGVRYRRMTKKLSLKTLRAHTAILVESKSDQHHSLTKNIVNADDYATEKTTPATYDLV